ncbi:hypothetical protein C0995_005703 [Termitomyces sp. Mi166|nr:hypothetical protein C0995_005703 [Termitomyces sp. Mi166\
MSATKTYVYISPCDNYGVISCYAPPSISCTASFLRDGRLLLLPILLISAIPELLSKLHGFLVSTTFLALYRSHISSRAPPPYSTGSAQPYVILPPLKATVDIPPLQVPVTPYYWDPNKPYKEPIPPSPKSKKFDVPDGPEYDCGHYNDQSVFPNTYEDPEEKSQCKSPTLSRKSFTTRSLRSYGADLPFDSLNLAPRPAYWRPDYVPPHSASRKRSFLRRKLVGERYTPLTAGSRTNYTLHALIHYTSSSTHPLAYDIRQDPQTIDIQYLNLPRHSNNIDEYQVATTPPMHELHLYHRKLPWTITVRATQTNGITIGDIFDQIYENLSTRVTRQEFYNVVLSPSDREEMTTAFYYRGGLQTDNGMLRMDFLVFDVVFLGLAKGKNGLLEIKTGPASPP